VLGLFSSEQAFLNAHTFEESVGNVSSVFAREAVHGSLAISAALLVMLETKLISDAASFVHALSDHLLGSRLLLLAEASPVLSGSREPYSDHLLEGWVGLFPGTLHSSVETSLTGSVNIFGEEGQGAQLLAVFVMLLALLAVMVLLGSLLAVMVLLGSLLSVFMVLLRCLLGLLACLFGFLGLLHCLLGLLACLFGCLFGLLAALLGLFGCLFGLLDCLLGLLACLFGLLACLFGLFGSFLGLVFSGLHDHGVFLGIELGKHGNNETLSLLGSTAAKAGDGKRAKIRSGTHPLSLHCPVNLRHIGVGANDEG